MYKEFNLVELGGVINGHFRRNILCNVNEVDNKLKEMSFTDAYSTIYRYNNKDQNTSDVIAPFYIDLDIDDIENNYNKLKRDLLLVYRQLKNKLCLQDREIEIFFSGSKGFHIIINEKTLGIQPCRNLNDLYKLLALRLKSFTITKCIDTKIYDKKRLLRIPNTINHKTGLYKVPVTIEQVREFTYEQMKEYASDAKVTKGIKIYMKNQKANIAFYDWIEEVKEEEKKTINHKVARQFLEKKELLPCVKYILQNGSQQGGRNNTTNALASALLQLGKPYEEVLDIMQTWNSTKNTPPLPGREVEITTNSAFKNVEAGKRYGCSAIRMLGVCLKDCPIRK